MIIKIFQIKLELFFNNFITLITNYNKIFIFGNLIFNQKKHEINHFRYSLMFLFHYLRSRNYLKQNILWIL